MKLGARLRSTAGAAAVEFALVLLPFCLLVMGIIDYGWYFFVDLACTNAAREGARTATTFSGPCPNGVAVTQGTTAAQNMLTAALGAAYANSADITTACTQILPAPAEEEQYQFSIQLTFPQLTGFRFIPMPGGVPGKATVQTSVTMRGN